MVIFERIGFYFQTVASIASDPIHLAILFGSVMLGIIFGAMPGLTSTLGVALLTALTYGMDTATAMVCLLAIYVGGTYGGSYASILINIPGTAASAATALDGYPLARKGEGGRAQVGGGAHHWDVTREHDRCAEHAEGDPPGDLALQRRVVSTAAGEHTEDIGGAVHAGDQEYEDEDHGHPRQKQLHTGCRWEAHGPCPGQSWERW